VRSTPSPGGRVPWSGGPCAIRRDLQRRRHGARSPPPTAEISGRRLRRRSERRSEASGSLPWRGPRPGRRRGRRRGGSWASARSERGTPTARRGSPACRRRTRSRPMPDRRPNPGSRPSQCRQRRRTRPEFPRRSSGTPGARIREPRAADSARSRPTVDPPQVQRNLRPVSQRRRRGRQRPRFRPVATAAWRAAQEYR
jgi:hypothetical protein